MVEVDLAVNHLGCDAFLPLLAVSPHRQPWMRLLVVGFPYSIVADA